MKELKRKKNEIIKKIGHIIEEYNNKIKRKAKHKEAKKHTIKKYKQIYEWLQGKIKDIKEK